MAANTSRAVLQEAGASKGEREGAVGSLSKPKNRRREIRAIEKKARAAGIAIEERPCAACDGVGHLVYADPIDLRRMREANGFFSVSAFAASVIREDGDQGVTPGYIHMIENPSGDSARSRRCPEWLLEQYLKPPVNVKRHVVPPKTGLTPEVIARGVKASLAARRLKKAEALKEVRKPLPKPLPGEVWQRVKPCPPIRRIKIVSVVDGAVIYKPWNEDEKPPRSMRLTTLAAAYQRFEG